MSLEEELKQIVVDSPREIDIIEEALERLRVHTEKIQELFAKLAEKEECYPKSVGDEWYFIDVVESKHILKLKKEVLAELTTSSSEAIK